MVAEVLQMPDNNYGLLGLDDLLENDLTSYEFFCSLPKDIQERVTVHDIGSFSEMCQYVSQLRRMKR